MNKNETLKGVRIFNLFGIPVYINYSWVIIFALVAWSLARFYYPQKYSGGTPNLYWIMGVVSSLLLFLCVLLHELSHSLVARKVGIEVTHIVLFIFGGVSNMPKEPDSPRKDMLISAAGPLCSALLCVLCLAAGALTLTTSPLRPVFLYLALINGALAVFNLLPGFPLDGGRILRDIIWAKTGNLSKAAYVASNVGKAVGMGLIFLGILSFFQGNLVGGVWFVFIGIFMRSAAEQGYRQTTVSSGLSGIKVSQIMTHNPISVNPELTVVRLVEEYFYPYHHVVYPVIQDGRLLGIIDLKRIKELSPEERDRLTVMQVMTDLNPDLTLSPDEEVKNALQKLVGSKHGRLLIVKDNRLLGIISRRDIMDLLQIKMELG